MEANVKFFYDHAGYSYDPKVETAAAAGRLRCATALAGAERAARGAVYFDWGWESEVEGEYCVARLDETGETTSLGGIQGADDNYRRVVQAELALELLSPKGAPIA